MSGFDSMNPTDQMEVGRWIDRMGYHKATEVTVPIHRELRAKFMELAVEVIELVPEGRERALALTSLQESLMWANAGVAIVLAPLAVDD